jgi:hypothetical protein
MQHAKSYASSQLTEFLFFFYLFIFGNPSVYVNGQLVTVATRRESAAVTLPDVGRLTPNDTAATLAYLGRRKNGTSGDDVGALIQDSLLSAQVLNSLNSGSLAQQDKAKVAELRASTVTQLLAATRALVGSGSPPAAGGAPSLLMAAGFVKAMRVASNVNVAQNNRDDATTVVVIAPATLMLAWQSVTLVPQQLQAKQVGDIATTVGQLVTASDQSGASSGSSANFTVASLEVIDSLVRAVQFNSANTSGSASSPSVVAASSAGKWASDAEVNPGAASSLAASATNGTADPATIAKAGPVSITGATQVMNAAATIAATSAGRHPCQLPGTKIGSQSGETALAWGSLANGSALDLGSVSLPGDRSSGGSSLDCSVAWITSLNVAPAQGTLFYRG